MSEHTPLTAFQKLKLRDMVGRVSVAAWAGRAAELYETLPPPQREKLAHQVRGLRLYLEQQGRHLPADLLLEVACLTKAMRDSPGSPHLNLEETPDEFSAMELRQAAFVLERLQSPLDFYENLSSAERAELSQYVRRFGIDLSGAAVNQPLRLIATLGHLGETSHAAMTADAKREILADYLALSPEEGQQLAQVALRFWQTELESKCGTAPEHRLSSEIWDVPDTLRNLACLVPGSLQECHPALIEMGVFYPAELYTDANPETRDHLIRMLEMPPHGRDAIDLIAWIGDEVVKATFHRWRQSPPAWGPRHAWGIAQSFARDAGWELTESGGRRDLFHPECYQLIPIGDAATTDSPDPNHLPPSSLFPEYPVLLSTDPVAVITPHEEMCRWCAQPLATMFDLSSRP